MEKTITISMEEYKELLQIKGRYEELKEQKRYENSIPTTIYKPLLTREEKPLNHTELIQRYSPTLTTSTKEVK